MMQHRGQQDGSTPDAETLGRLSAALGAIANAKGPPPVELWNPPYCGEIDIVIQADGAWLYHGTPIARPALVKLFASVLRRDPDRHVLVTPVECLGIQVVDAPFLAVEMAVERRGLARSIAFRTNLDDLVAVGPDHPLRFALEPEGGVKPYVLVRGGLWARITRALALDLLDLGEESTVEGRTVFGIAVAGAVYPVDNSPA